MDLATIRRPLFIERHSHNRSIIHQRRIWKQTESRQEVVRLTDTSAYEYLCTLQLRLRQVGAEVRIWISSEWTQPRHRWASGLEKRIHPAFRYSCDETTTAD